VVVLVIQQIWILRLLPRWLINKKPPKKELEKTQKKLNNGILIILMRSIPWRVICSITKSYVKKKTLGLKSMQMLYIEVKLEIRKEKVME
jgi:branched-subunit amino acid transport protein AzlD